MFNQQAEGKEKPTDSMGIPPPQKRRPEGLRCWFEAYKVLRRCTNPDGSTGLLLYTGPLAVTQLDVVTVTAASAWLSRSAERFRSFRANVRGGISPV